MTSKPPERLRLDRLATPIGEALIVTDEAGYLRAFDWADREAGMARLLRLHYGSVVPEAGCRAEPHQAPAAALLRRRRRMSWRHRMAHGRHAVPAHRMDRVSPRSRRATTLSYGALAAKLGCPKCGSRRRPGQRVQSDQRGGAVSSRDRRRWLADRLRRRHRAQTLAAQPRGRGVPRRAGSSGARGLANRARRRQHRVRRAQHCVPCARHCHCEERSGPGRDPGNNVRPVPHLTKIPASALGLSCPFSRVRDAKYHPGCFFRVTAQVSQ